VRNPSEGAESRSVESAILLEVPEAEPVVGPLRAEGDASAAHGVPAHVTLLYPFVDDPDVGIVEELRWFFAGVDAFPLEFATIGEFPEVVYLEPTQAADVSGLIDALVRRWPGYPPYGGMFDEVVPHLTVVDTPDPALRARARELPGLPVRSVAREASLWVHDADVWRCLARFPLAEMG
jgi:2'-5' RNA ligase